VPITGSPDGVDGGAVDMVGIEEGLRREGVERDYLSILCAILCMKVGKRVDDGCREVSSTVWVSSTRQLRLVAHPLQLDL
jgi:hypothetical protein